MFIFNDRPRASRPNPEVEKRAAANSEVITRKMTPEDLAKFDKAKPARDSFGKKIRKPVAPSVDRSLQERNEKTSREAKKERERSLMKSGLTKEKYFDLRIDGKTRTRIIREDFKGTPNSFYSILDDWGIRDARKEDEEIFKYRVKQMGLSMGDKTVTKLRDEIEEKDEEIKRLQETVKEVAQEANASAAQVEELEQAVEVHKSHLKAAEAYVQGVPNDEREPGVGGMTIGEYERLASRTAVADWDKIAVRVLRDKRLMPLLNYALGATGEAGEIADEIKKAVFHGHELDTEKLVKEIGDTLWYLSQLSHTVGYTLQFVADQNIKKLKERYPEGFSEDKSKNRAG